MAEIRDMIFGRILVAVDAGISADVLCYAAAMAVRCSAILHVVCVVDPVEGGGLGWADMSTAAAAAECERAERAVAAACDDLRSRGVACEGHVRVGPVVDAIRCRAEEVSASLIVLGHRHLGQLRRLFDPSVVRDLLEVVACPVLVVPLSEAGE